ncbi:hypothetical protein PR048_007909 [Dryococelus australis]|uniref:Uncharacterized protein n=1 Tax=Dryococelus australis TaxID=614101 RepID=A0ABQ9HVK6_9NEOP|nr:hypothetical protein PR048_007909 [Dryococelus australis]
MERKTLVYHDLLVKVVFVCEAKIDEARQLHDKLSALTRCGILMRASKYNQRSNQLQPMNFGHSRRLKVGDSEEFLRNQEKPVGACVKSVRAFLSVSVQGETSIVKQSEISRQNLCRAVSLLAGECVHRTGGLFRRASAWRNGRNWPLRLPGATYRSSRFDLRKQCTYDASLYYSLDTLEIFVRFSHRNFFSSARCRYNASLRTLCELFTCAIFLIALQAAVKYHSDRYISLRERNSPLAEPVFSADSTDRHMLMPSFGHPATIIYLRLVIRNYGNTVCRIIVARSFFIRYIATIRNVLVLNPGIRSEDRSQKPLGWDFAERRKYLNSESSNRMNPGEGRTLRKLMLSGNTSAVFHMVKCEFSGYYNTVTYINCARDRKVFPNTRTKTLSIRRPVPPTYLIIKVVVYFGVIIIPRFDSKSAFAVLLEAEFYFVPKLQLREASSFHLFRDSLLRAELQRNMSYACERWEGGGGGPYTRQKAKPKYRNRIRLQRAPQKKSSNTHKTLCDRVKRCREREINTKASERVNVDVYTQNKLPCP